ncbi:MAG: DUF4160 domain-containing protein [Flavobacteriales bacterium]|nr:DUF4160 domain-containing protein [Flavobacteriales bacterium]MBP6696799.1 DUF4160 domain-containing protein [Flavobacteriales bacterium]
MPTVLVTHGFRFKFYSNENNELPHVHVVKGTAEAKWWLDPELEEEFSVGFKVQELRMIRTLLKQHRDELLEAWEEHFSE